MSQAARATGPLTTAYLIDQACDAFEAAWIRHRPGNPPPRLEDALAALPQVDPAQLLHELLLVEWEWRRRRGETPRLDSYTERFPNYEPVLRAVFAAEAAPPRTDGEGKLLGDYELLSRIGQGGMGVVYKARQRSTHRLVALKVIRPDRLEELPAPARARWLRRFRQEAEAAANLQHDNAVTVFDVGDVDGQPYYSMRYVEGRSLAQMLTDGPVAGRSAARYVEQVARAVHEAHARGILHRDLKPRNILVDLQDRALVADFGLAKWMSGDGDMTQTGDCLGTPAYIAPEQARNAAEATVASDVYGLGATLYDLLTGRPPFQAATAAETLQQVLHKEPVPPRQLNPAIDRDLETITLKCLQKEPGRRYPDVAALADDLHRYLCREPIRARPVGALERCWLWAKRRPAVAGLLGLVLVVLAVGFAGVAWQWRRADTALDKEATQRQRAEATLYFSRIGQARLEWLANDVASAERHLDLCTPLPGQPELRGWEWHYLRRLCHADLHTLRGHRHWVHGIAFSPDGRHLASGGADAYVAGVAGEIKLWDTVGGHEIAGPTGPTRGVLAVAFHPDGRRLATAGGDLRGEKPGELKVWDPQTGQELLSLDGFTYLAWCVAFSPDGQYLAAAQAGGVKVWDATTGREVRDFRGHTRQVMNLKFSADGRRLVSTDAYDHAWVWDVASARELLRLPGQWNDAAFSPDGQYLATAGEAGTATLWESATGREVQSYRGHIGRLTSLAFHPDGQRLATGSADSTVRVWDVKTGQELVNYRGHTAGVRCVAFSPDGRRLASAGQDQTVKLWDLARHPQSLTLRRQAQTPRRHEYVIEALAFVGGPEHLASTCLYSKLCTWDAGTGQLLTEASLSHRPGQRWPIVERAFRADGYRLAAVNNKDPRAVDLWEVPSGRMLQTLTGHTQPVTCLAFAPDGQRLASAASDGIRPGGPGEVKIWDLRTGRELQTFQGHQHSITCLSFSPDGQRLASASHDETVRVWEAATGRELFTLTGHRECVSSVACGPDGRHLASCGYFDQTVRLWDAGTGEELFRLPAPLQLTHVTFSPDGRRLAAASLDVVKLWDTATGQEAFTLRGLTNQRKEDFAYNARVVFSPDGQRIASTNWDHSINVWDAAPAQGGRTPNTLLREVTELVPSTREGIK